MRLALHMRHSVLNYCIWAQKSVWLEFRVADATLLSSLQGVPSTGKQLSAAQQQVIVAALQSEVICRRMVVSQCCCLLHITVIELER